MNEISPSPTTIQVSPSPSATLIKAPPNDPLQTAGAIIAIAFALATNFDGKIDLWVRYDLSGNEIAQELDSNFDGKDDLFLAVLDDHVERRVGNYEATAFKEETVDGFIRLMARGQFVLDAEEVAWQPLLVEFWTHASRDEALRQAVSARHSRVVDAAASVLVQLAEECDADLLVIGNKGMHRRVLGSVPNSVTHKAPCSVFVVKTT